MVALEITEIGALLRQMLKGSMFDISYYRRL